MVLHCGIRAYLKWLNRFLLQYLYIQSITPCLFNSEAEVPKLQYCRPRVPGMDGPARRHPAADPGGQGRPGADTAPGRMVHAALLRFALRADGGGSALSRRQALVGSFFLGVESRATWLPTQPARCCSALSTRRFKMLYYW